jgi:nuclear pore complex protein Nup205
MLLSYCHARLALLLQIAQTRFGAAAVLNAGLFHFVAESSLFKTDPDLGVGKFLWTLCLDLTDGLDITGPNAHSKHYNLLVAITRVICATLLSRGSQNQQSLEQGRKFLTDNSLSILAVLKKSAGLGAGVQATEQIDELADSFMLLVTFSQFLEVRISAPCY